MRAARVLKFVVLGALAATLFTFLVRALWNWLMPGVFGLHLITFWQALRHPGAEQDSLRRISRPAGLGWTLARPHDAAVGEHDAGGARKVPLGLAPWLRQPDGDSADSASRPEGVCMRAGFLGAAPFVSKSAGFAAPRTKAVSGHY